MRHEKTIGKPCAGNPHARFERGDQEPGLARAPRLIPTNEDAAPDVHRRYPLPTWGGIGVGGRRKVAVFGVPSAAGGRHPAQAEAPNHLRAAGLLEALRGAGLRVVNLSDLSLFPYRDDPEHPRARNAEVVACAVRAAADEMTRALAEGFTLVLGGDCPLVAGVVGGAGAALGPPVGPVYPD